MSGVARCPVSVVFTIPDSHAFFEEEGQTRYTCCGGCMEKLRKTPTVGGHGRSLREHGSVTSAA